MIASHCVYVNEQDAQLMAQNQVSVVNTPLCEMKIADGIAPVPLFEKMGIKVLIGTDGAMWNNSNDMFREMKAMVLLHTVNSGIRSLNTCDVLDMATINGAEAFGLGHSKGSLFEGKDADIILLDTKEPHMQPLRIGPHANAASLVVYNATGRDVTDVFIYGKAVMRNRTITTVNEKGIIEKVKNASDRIAEKLPECLMH